MRTFEHLMVAPLFLAGAGASGGIPVPQLLSTEPAQPRAHQPFDVTYRLEVCGARFAPDLAQNRIVTVDQSRIIVTSKYYLSLCFEGQQYATQYTWRVGNIPAGTYQLELRAYYEESGPGMSFPIASGEVTIAPPIVVTPPNVVPVAGRFGLLSLSLLTIVLGMWTLRRR